MGGIKNKDIEGKKFGKLKIIKDLGTKGKNYKRWVDIKCDCGQFQRCRYDKIKSGDKTNCGCERGLKITVGEKFGRVTVIADLGRKGKHNELYCLGQCECGNMKKFNYYSLRKGHSRSCGCLSVEQKRLIKNKICSDEHLYSIWTHMKSRCYNKNNDHYKYYGGKGIKVCKQWKNNYLSFRKWSFKNGYKTGQRKKEFKNRLSIDRIDSSDDYKPNNCQFLTISENSKKQFNS